MGHNPRYRFWQTENWMGFAPTAGAMERRQWRLTLHCRACRLAVSTTPAKIIAARGRDWSPWGKTAPCPRLDCGGRMLMKAYDPLSGLHIDI